jgi:DNA polymerase/3'-5' exonuclease PolX
MRLKEAKQYAEELIDLLNPACRRIKIAGGIRREKSEPHDVELVAEPLIGGNDWGGLTDKTNWLNKRIRDLFIEYPMHFIHAPPNKAGAKAPFSEKYYKFLYKLAPIDLFVVTPPAQWGTVFLIRTGDAEFSHAFVTRLWNYGLRSVDGHIEESETGNILNTAEESDAFTLCHLPNIEPKLRTLETIKSLPP